MTASNLQPGQEDTGEILPEAGHLHEQVLRGETEESDPGSAVAQGENETPDPTEPDEQQRQDAAAARLVIAGSGETEVRAATGDDTESGPASRERRIHGREEFSVTYLNTSFSGAFDHPESLDRLLLDEHGQPRENEMFGFSEIVFEQRERVQDALEARGYQVVAPPDDSRLDLVWAVGPGVTVRNVEAHHFPRKGLRKIASRTGSDHYRHIGVLELTVETADGNEIEAGLERLPPVLIEPTRRLTLKDLERWLTRPGRKGDPLLRINGGDMNHINSMRGADDRMWGRMKGWQVVLARDAATHSTEDKYKISGKVARFLRRGSNESQLDAAYAQPADGYECVEMADPDTELEPNQIGYRSETEPVAGTDHYRVRTTYSLPSARGSEGLAEFQEQ